MKNWFFTIMLIGFSIKTPAQIKNIIKGSPFPFAIGILHIEYERVLSSGLSVGGFLSPYGSGSRGIWTMYKFYITHQSRFVPSGLYIGPNLGYVSFDESQFPLMGAQLGYQWAKFKGLTVDLSIGPEYSLISDSEIFGYPFPFMKFNLGYAW